MSNRAQVKVKHWTIQIIKTNVFICLELELPCSHPGNIDHGLTDWNGTGSVAKFACYQGYYLVGPPKLICRYGLWLFFSKIYFVLSGMADGSVMLRLTGPRASQWCVVSPASHTGHWPLVTLSDTRQVEQLWSSVMRDTSSRCPATTNWCAGRMGPGNQVLVLSFLCVLKR